MYPIQSYNSAGLFRSIVHHQQVRNISRRKIAYPVYPFKRLGRQHPKRHDTNLKSAMRQFLGPKNYKGEYIMNKYFEVPNNHEPKYIKPDLERGQSLTHPITGEAVLQNYDGSFGPAPENKRLQSISERRALQPFPGNPHCRTNFIISDDLKMRIYNDIQLEGLSTQTVSQNYGVKVTRIEAIVKLIDIEQKWEKNSRINKDLQAMSSTLYKMFPIFDSSSFKARENLSEIPVPQKALSSRFLTIAESEPFGPIDAAKILDLEPAAVTLEKLSAVGEHSLGHTTKKTENTKVVYGELLSGEKTLFKFTTSKVGSVGFRYGSGNRDSKKDRKIGFNELGKMIYI